MSYPGSGRRPAPDGPPNLKLNVQVRNADGSTKLKVDLLTYTLSRGPDMRPLQFHGEILGEVERDVHRAAIYRTQGGKFVSEFSMVDSAGERTGKADVFGSINEACDWFRPGHLTTELLKRLNRWEPEFIE